MKYSNLENFTLVVNLLKKKSIKNIVISPGGTNIIITKAVQSDRFFQCYSVVDERSAVYYAIGIYLQTGMPVATICTSAQATRNYIPGLTEAFYKKVPILAITMEKHPRFKYQEYMQAPDQTSLPNDCVKKSFELPFISDINDVYHSIRLVNQAILELTHNGYGPVQLCIPLLDFQLSKVETPFREIKRFDVDFVKNIDFSKKKILIAIGEHRPFSETESDAIDHFCKYTDSVIYTNHLSNFKNDYSLNANLLLATVNDEELKKLKPDILITIGGQTGDYPFYLCFSKNNLICFEHWRICEDGDVVDTYDKLTLIFQGAESDFFSGAKEIESTHCFFDIWQQELAKRKNNITVPFSNVSIAQYLHSRLPKKSIVQFSILNSLRVWNFFRLDPSIECYSNVGAFGIDGGMSTLIGQSVVTNKISIMVIGDLAFFYDMNSLSIRHIRNNLRVLLINNNGGIEFKLRGEERTVVDDYIAAANHNLNAKGWAETCGFKYLCANNIFEFVNSAEEFLSDSMNPVIFEVFVNDQDESKAYLSIIEANQTKTASEIVKFNIIKSVKRIIGKDNFDELKKKIKR